jgi:hypothetical protein
MPINRPRRPRTRIAITSINVEDAAVDRALIATADAVSRIESRIADRSTVVADLIVGDNVLLHRLGRKPRGAHVAPTVADASYAAAMTSADATHATITVIGVAQPGALVEFVG